jgi:hypothetical protein
MKSYKKAFLMIIAVNLLIALSLSLRLRIEKESSNKLENSNEKVQKTESDLTRWSENNNQKVRGANNLNNKSLPATNLNLGNPSGTIETLPTQTGNNPNNLKIYVSDNNFSTLPKENNSENINERTNNPIPTIQIEDIKHNRMVIQNIPNNKVNNFNNNQKKLIDCFFEKTEKTNCDCDEGLKGTIINSKKEKETRVIMHGKFTIIAPIKKSWPLELPTDFGTDDVVGYIFDYFDVVFQYEVTYEFLEIYWTLFSVKFENKDDPYWEKFLTGEEGSFENLATDKKKAEIHIDYDGLEGPKFVIIDRALYDASIAIPQLEKFFQEWKWQFNGKTETDSARHFVDAYDINGDGRLSPKELLFGVIVENTENTNCNYCLDEMRKKFQLVFLYIKCHKDKYLNPTQIVKKLKYLKRQTKALYNIYTCWDDKLRLEIITRFFKQIHTAEKFEYKDVQEKIEIMQRLDVLTFKKSLLLGFMFRQVSDYAIYAHQDMLIMFNNQEHNKDIKIPSDSKVILNDLDGFTKKDIRWDNTKKVMKKCSSQSIIIIDPVKDCY